MRYIIEEHTQALCRKELRPDLFNSDDPCTAMTSDKFNMEHNCKLHEEAMVGAEQKVTKFFQTPVEIDEARTMGQALLNHRVQELTESSRSGMDLGNGRLNSIPRPTTRLAGASSCLALQECAGCSVVLRKPKAIWKGGMVKMNHTNNTSEMKAMLAAHVLIQHLQSIAGWQEARHEAPVQRST